MAEVETSRFYAGEWRFMRAERYDGKIIMVLISCEFG
jgi:hypothetical protein